MPTYDLDLARWRDRDRAAFLAVAAAPDRDRIGAPAGRHRPDPQRRYTRSGHAGERVPTAPGAPASRPRPAGRRRH